MTMTGPCEMSGLSPKFFGAGSKFPYVSLFMPNLFIDDNSRRRRGCHSIVKPAKKSFVMVMFQHSVSNLLHNVFCSFPNSFPKVSVVNMVHRQRKGSNVRKSSFGARTKTQVCWLTFMHNFPGPWHSGRPKEMLISFPSSPGCESSRGWGIWVESLVDIISLFSIHFMTCNKGGLGK